MPILKEQRRKTKRTLESTPIPIYTPSNSMRVLLMRHTEGFFTSVREAEQHLERVKRNERNNINAPELKRRFLRMLERAQS